MTRRIKILFFASNPVDTSRLRLDEEIREIGQRIQLASHRDQFEFIQQFAVRPADVQQALLQHQPQIVHFSGHSTTTEGIILEDSSGKGKVLSKEALADLFDILKDNIRVVVLNACFTVDQAESIKHIIDYTVGMKTAIGDPTSIVFSAAFYGGLGFGRTVRESFRLARNLIMSEGIPGHETPELLVRDGVDESVPLLSSKEPQKPGKKSSGRAGAEQHTGSHLELNDNTIQAGRDLSIGINDKK